MGLLRATAYLFATQVRRLARSRRGLLALLVALSPVAASLAVLYASEVVGPPPALTIGWSLVVTVVVPLLALVLGSAAVAEEAEDGTLSYLFTRPIPRPAVLLGRWLAALVPLTALVLLATEASFRILGASAAGDPENALPPGIVADLRVVAVLGVVVYSAVFAALGAALRHPVIVGLGYVFAYEAFLGTLPGQTQELTVQFHLKSWLARGGEDALRRFEVATAGVELAEPAAALRTLALVLAVALAAGCAAVARREYAARR